LRRLPYIHHFARFAHVERHPGIRTQAKNYVRSSHSSCAADIEESATRASFMTFYHSDRQGIL
jgi:hypothetical protein